MSLKIWNKSVVMNILGVLTDEFRLIFQLTPKISNEPSRVKTVCVEVEICVKKNSQ